MNSCSQYIALKTDFQGWVYGTIYRNILNMRVNTNKVTAVADGIHIGCGVMERLSSSEMNCEHHFWHKYIVLLPNSVTYGVCVNNHCV